MKPLGLYLHVPFCRQKCLYCDFCSYAGRSADDRARYVTALCGELSGKADAARDYSVDTVYFGGGTPTLLSPEEICRVLDTVRARYPLTSDAEITMECNPATIDEAALCRLRAFGVNRLSVGMQSAVDGELAALGRIHVFADVKATVAAARRAGFDNLSLDLMFGIPEQTEDSFRRSLDAALALSPEHISAYSLMIEEGTPFFDRRGSLPLPDEDAVLAMTDDALWTLRAAGYERYEISNYARPGRESRHNLHYWNLDDYIGFGPAAHSLLGGVRWGHSRDLAAYLRGEDTVEPEETLTPDGAREEYVMLRLRLAAGVEKADFRERFGEDFDARYAERIRRYLAAGFMADSPERVAFTDKGFNVSNSILADILEL